MSTKSLDSLVRLYKFQLDEKKRKLSDVRDMAGQLSHGLKMLDEELEREQAIASRNSTHASMFAAFRTQAAARKVTLMQSIERLEEEVLHINDEITAHFQELKRYETAREDRVSTARVKRDKRETAFADELALQQHRVLGGQAG
jgi:flagellar protein FliJ